MNSMDYLHRTSPPAPEARNTCCYVLNLPQCIDERFLGHIMSSYGEIESVKVVPNSPTHSTSVGFVNMKTSSDAETAVRALQGADVETGTLELVTGPPVGSKRPDFPKSAASLAASPGSILGATCCRDLTLLLPMHSVHGSAETP